MAKKDVTIAGKDGLRESNTIRETTVNGCKVILNFLPESDSKKINAAKSILLSSCYQDTTQKLGN